MGCSPRLRAAARAGRRAAHPGPHANTSLSMERIEFCRQVNLAVESSGWVGQQGLNAARGPCCPACAPRRWRTGRPHPAAPGLVGRTADRAQRRARRGCGPRRRHGRRRPGPAALARRGSRRRPRCTTHHHPHRGGGRSHGAGPRGLAPRDPQATYGEAGAVRGAARCPTYRAGGWCVSSAAGYNAGYAADPSGESATSHERPVPRRPPPA